MLKLIGKNHEIRQKRNSESVFHRINSHGHGHCYNRRYNKVAGFTLIELLIVIVILGILVAVTMVTINPQERMAKARDNQREIHGSAIWYAIEQKIFREGGMVDCEEIPTLETKISSSDYNLYECIFPEYLQQTFYDPTTGYFNNKLNYDTGYYIAIDSFGNPYFRAEGETRDVVIGATPGFSIVTHSATGVGEYSATIRGELTNMGEATSTNTWFEYGKTDSFELGKVCENVLLSTGTFNCPLTGLDIDTMYYFRAFGENVGNSEESSQGRTRRFTTSKAS